MKELKKGQLLRVQAIAAQIEGLKLLQDEILEIETVSNFEATFTRLSDGQQYTISKMALMMVAD